MIVVACNAATSAALPDLQQVLSVPVLGVITPEAYAAVQGDPESPDRPARHAGDRDGAAVTRR